MVSASASLWELRGDQLENEAGKTSWSSHLVVEWAFDSWLTKTSILQEGNTDEAPGTLPEPQESIGKECQHSPSGQNWLGGLKTSVWVVYLLFTKQQKFGNINRDEDTFVYNPATLPDIHTLEKLTKHIKRHITGNICNRREKKEENKTKQPKFSLSGEWISCSIFVQWNSFQ